MLGLYRNSTHIESNHSQTDSTTPNHSSQLELKISQNTVNNSSDQSGLNNIINCSAENDDSLLYVPLSEKVTKRYARGAGDEPFFSVEFFPPRYAKNAHNWIQLLDTYKEGEPYFCDITWHAAGNPGHETPTSSITMAGIALNYCCFDTMLHITCMGLTQDKLREHLERAKALGIKNVLALRGDKHESLQITEFHYASDLVAFIRKEYGNYFTIVVAGYPIPHPESLSREHDLYCLKQKIDAGADFIITQLFFEAQDFIQFVRDCRAIGINVPIIPGICAINSYESLLKFAKLSDVPIPEKVLIALEPIKSNVEAVQNFGIDFLVKLCRELIDSHLSPGLHFFTLNQKSIVKVLKALGLWKKIDIERVLPWKVATNHRRLTESTRPVFWSNRPRSYIYRSLHWHEYPFAHWSANLSNQLADNLDNCYPFIDKRNTKEELLQFLGDNPTVNDVYEIFYSYYSKYKSYFDINQNQVTKSISLIPWIQHPNSHELELAFLFYGSYILKGILITNYLPCLNGISSENQKYGWGEPNGYIYQKEYLEFFLDSKYLPKLREILSEEKCLNYMVANKNGTIVLTNWPRKIPVTISWGLFPSYQLVPTYVADIRTFQLWRNETFALFDTWSTLFEPNSDCYATIKQIKDKYLLVSLIDNQFAERDRKKLENILKKLTLSEME